MAFIRCWTCTGNGATAYPGCASTICEDCKGSGCDVEKTRATTVILESEKTYPK